VFDVLAGKCSNLDASFSDGSTTLPLTEVHDCLFFCSILVADNIVQRGVCDASFAVV